jgi:hypothetical protein
MTASELKAKVEASGNAPHMFDRKTMRAFGDTMRNFGVRPVPIPVETSTQGTVSCWELYRRRPVKNGAQSSYFFNVATFARVHPKR